MFVRFFSFDSIDDFVLLNIFFAIDTFSLTFSFINFFRFDRFDKFNEKWSLSLFEKKNYFQRAKSRDAILLFSSTSFFCNLFFKNETCDNNWKFSLSIYLNNSHDIDLATRCFFIFVSLIFFNVVQFIVIIIFVFTQSLIASSISFITIRHTTILTFAKLKFLITSLIWDKKCFSNRSNV